MRAILSGFIRQAATLERFKQDPCAENALRVCFDFSSGDVAGVKTDGISYNQEQQLQLDAVAVFLIALVEMIDSGLALVYSSGEVAFIQNLVYYIERAYRVPDFGMWGRGSKHNCGQAELGASSVGAVRAALSALDGFNVYGSQGAKWSVINVDQDALCRNQRTLEALLPRQSSSKFTDAALLPTLSWPCFASSDPAAFQRITEGLSRPKGLIRFDKDGFGTKIEDTTRHHYLPAELKKFDGIESEWPVFFAFLLIDAKFKQDDEQAATYRQKLNSCLVNQRCPTYYQVVGKSREPVFRTNMTWVDSVSIIACMLSDGVVSPEELDPLRLASRRATGCVDERTIQVTLISENASLQRFLSSYGVVSETPAQTEPIVIWPSQDLVKVYAQMGYDRKLGLTGRPKRPIGVLGSSRVYRILGRTVVAYPLVFDVSDFYISSDTDSLIDNVWFSLDFLKKYFNPPTQPLFLFILREDLCRGPRLRPLLELLAAFRRGVWRDVKIRLGRLQSFVANAEPVKLTFVSETPTGELGQRGLNGRSQSLSSLQAIITDDADDTFLFNQATLNHINATDDTNQLMDIYRNSKSHREKAHVLVKLSQFGIDEIDGYPVKGLLNNLLRHFTKEKDWARVRLVAAHCRKLVDSLAPSVTTILCEGKQLSIGVFGHGEITISSPLSPAQISDILYSVVFEINPSEAVLQQEIILTLGQRILVTQPQLLDRILNIRIGWLIEAMRFELSRRPESPCIYSQSPSEVKALLEEVLSLVNIPDQFYRRKLEGALSKAPVDFYHHVWRLLERAESGVMIQSRVIPPQPTLSDMDATDVGFKLIVENTLQLIKQPEHRHLVVETIIIISTILKRNPELKFKTMVDINDIIEDAITDYSGSASFYSLSPPKLIKHITHSVIKTLLLSGDLLLPQNHSCKVS